MQIKSMKVFAKLLLLTATIIWGASFLIMKNTLETIDTFYLLAIRFLGASIILAPIFIKVLKTATKNTINKGIILGLTLFFAYAFQTYGLKYTTPSKNAFLTAAYCILVPFLYWLIHKKRPLLKHIISSAVCVVGIGLVALNTVNGIEIGDALTLISSIFYGVHLIMVASFSQTESVSSLTVIEFATTGLISLICGLLFNEAPTVFTIDTVYSMGYLVILATACALLFQNIGQKYVHPSTASIILSLESVFGAVFSIIFFDDKLSPRVIIGFALIFFSIMANEYNPNFKLFKKKNIK